MHKHSAFDLYNQNENESLLRLQQRCERRHQAKRRAKIGISCGSFRKQTMAGPILIYAAGETDADMLYASGFQAPDPFTFIRTATGRRHLLMSDLEIDRARAQSTAHRVHSLTSLTRQAHKRFGSRAGMAETIATFLASLKIRGVDVPSNFPVALADQLRKRNIRVTPASGTLFPQRFIKRTHEIDEIRKAMRATERGMRCAVDALRRSRIKGGYLVVGGRRLTVESLRTIINTAVLAEGYLAMNTIVAPGEQGCDPHERGHGPLRANTPIIIDIFPRGESSGYYGDMTRTFVRGKASDFVKRLHRVVRTAQRLGLELIRHGVNGRIVHSAIDDLFVQGGFETGRQDGRMQGFFHSTGHGLGLDIHEPPRIGATDAILKAGMVVTVEPGLYYYPHGGVRIEDTVLVTRTGIENLTRFPKYLEI
jgi:Xaa-Pro aminopeptidase